jgi:hypothetical protein
MYVYLHLSGHAYEETKMAGSLKNVLQEIYKGKGDGHEQSPV